MQHDYNFCNVHVNFNIGVSAQGFPPRLHKASWVSSGLALLSPLHTNVILVLPEHQGERSIAFSGPTTEPQIHLAK